MDIQNIDSLFSWVFLFCCLSCAKEDHYKTLPKPLAMYTMASSFIIALTPVSFWCFLEGNVHFQFDSDVNSVHCKDAGLQIISINILKI